MCTLVQVDVGPAADLPPGFFESVRAGTPPRASSSDSGGVLGEQAQSVDDHNFVTAMMTTSPCQTLCGAP